MKKLKDICSLLRIKHYIKNLAIIVPAFFGGLVGDAHKMRMGLLGVCAFSAVSEYSCAMKSHFRKSGNQMSGKWKSSYASLLA